MMGRLAWLRALPLSIAVMALLLVIKSAAFVRAAVPAMATTAAGHEADVAPKPSDSAGAAGPALPIAVKAEAPPVSDAERALLLDLRARRLELDRREAALMLRETVLAATEKRVTVRADELLLLQQKLEALEKARHARDQANWAELVKVYEGMKPRDAAAIFNDLDLAVMLPVFDRMKPARMAVVLAAMLPERARLVTAQLAQMRNKANVPPGAAIAPARNGT